MFTRVTREKTLLSQTDLNIGSNYKTLQILDASEMVFVTLK